MLLQTNKRIGQYNIICSQLLGKGRFGRVYKCNNEKKEQFAVKITPFSHPKNENKQQIQINIKRQKDIMLSIDHKNIVRVQNYLQSQNNHYLIMELCQQSLRDKIKTNINKKLFIEESVAINYLIQILKGYKILYFRGIMHRQNYRYQRDLKPENILIIKDIIKIGDFNTARMYEISESSEESIIMSNKYYSKDYAALEILSTQYNYKCDIWSIGVIFFELLHNEKPFSCSIFELEQSRPQIKYRPSLSKEIIDFIQSCLKVDPSERVGFQELIKHPIVKQQLDNSTESVAEQIMRQLCNSINKKDSILQAKKALTEQQSKQKYMGLEEFEKLMTKISELMDKSKSKIVFDEYKDINEKVSVFTIRRLLGISIESMQNSTIFVKSQEGQ